ncbi:hypothetical protein ACWGJP_15885 [Microbacterium sp. NPDC055903]
MTALHTRPIPRPVHIHEHGWIVESRHATSEGRILYVRCADCGARRIDLEAHPAAPPLALSRPLAPSERP